MDYLPLFAELKQRPVLVIGGGEIAERKIKFLLRAQAQVQVVAETLSPALADLAARRHSAGGRRNSATRWWMMSFW